MPDLFCSVTATLCKCVSSTYLVSARWVKCIDHSSSCDPPWIRDAYHFNI